MKQYKKSYICVVKYGKELEKNSLTSVLDVFSFVSHYICKNYTPSPLYKY